MGLAKLGLKLSTSKKSRFSSLEKDSLEKSRRKIYLKGGLEKVCTYEINFFEIDSKKYLLYEFYDANQTKELNRMKRQTISTVTATFSKGLAHEIRNPLSGIKGATQLLEPKLKNDDLKEYTRICLLYTSPSPRDQLTSRMPSSA